MKQPVYHFKTIAITTEHKGRSYEHRITLEHSSYSSKSLVLRIAGTPGHWYLATLFGSDGFGRRVGPTLSIDMGQNWDCINMDQIMAEVESLFGTLVDAKDFSLIQNET